MISSLDFLQFTIHKRDSAKSTSQKHDPEISTESCFLFGGNFKLTVPEVDLQTMMGKLLLKSNCVTLFPLLLKETSYFQSVPFFPVTVPFQLLVTALLKVTKALLVTTKSN
jgi:hypothetical protein